MRTWRLLFAVGLLAALVVPASGASAKPHETGTTPHTTCAVNGGVELSQHPDNPSGGLDSNRSNGHYEFRQTELDCQAVLLDGKTDTFEVTAEGDTTDQWHGNAAKDGLGNGEDCEQGGSVKIDEDGDGKAEELHSGTLTAVGSDWEFDGAVHFARLGTTVLADGPLTVTGATDSGKVNDEHFFQAELEFVPTEGDCASTPVTAAQLTGVAEIYDVTDAAYFHDCTQEELSKAVNDPHCTL